MLALEHFIFPLSIGPLSGKVIREETNGIMLKVASMVSRKFKLFYDF